MKDNIDDKSGRKIQYAWYSVQQAVVGGVVIWKNNKGEEIECTCVTSSMEHNMRWDDLSPLGEVVSFVKRKSFGILDNDEKLGKLDATEMVSKLRTILNINSIQEDKRKDHRWN